MIFQENCIKVFLFVVIYVEIGESVNLKGINRTLFLFNHPNSCKNNEFYNLDYFTCLPCKSEEHLEVSFDKLRCDCKKNISIVALYDSSRNSPICSEKCKNKKSSICLSTTSLLYPQNPCYFNFINYTLEDQNGAARNISIHTKGEVDGNDCRCDLKYNYIYNDYCIWKPLLKNYLNYNAFWKRGKFYVDLKFTAFFCKSLQNTTACNNLANLCIQSFFDTDKNSPCSVFLLAQASDASLYSGMGENLSGLRPFLFYKKGKDSLEEMEQKIKIPDDTLDLFSTAYSFEGRLTRWENLRMKDVNLCGHDFSELHSYFHLFKNAGASCQLTLDSIIDMASIYGNKYFYSVFLNHSREDGNRYLQPIPVLIDNAFEGNKDLNSAEWQLVKRFQIIGVETAFNLASQAVLAYEDSHRLRFFKSIRVLRKFELRCTVTADKNIILPLIYLEYHPIEISLNTSLSEKYDFEFLIQFERDASSRKLYEIVLPVFLTISLLFAVFRAYIFKSRRFLECMDLAVFFETMLNFLSYIGNSFLAVVIIDVFYSVLTFLFRPHEKLLPLENNYIFEFFIYSALTLKGFYFVVNFWRISQIDIFFVDWERPKSYDASLHLKNNLETSSQCSSIRTFTEHNVSAWRIFFLANEWIDLNSKQKTSSFLQGFVSLMIFWIANSYLPSFYSNSTLKIFACVLVYSSVHFIQRLFRQFVFDQVVGCPLKRFIDICTLVNVSIFTLMDCSFGFYIHGRSPHGFSDTDMNSIIFQLQRESQNMCGKRGLLNDSDFQTYIVLPPLNLRKHIEQLLPLKQKTENLSQSHFQKDFGFTSGNLEGVLEKSTTAYNRVNRFFCAFIDHAIKDMDYIIKEKTFAEHLLNCELESFVGDQKGTFYIDNSLTFSSLFLYGNQNQLFLMELLIFLTMNLLTNNFTVSIVVVCILNKLFQKMFRFWVKNNISTKTLIDKRFLM